MDDYSVVIGLDAKTLSQLKLSWPTWKLHKPSLLRAPLIVFYDLEQIAEADILQVIQHPDITFVRWPWPGTSYQETSKDKWGNAQRAKMLSGFVHVPPCHVKTAYWLKIDTDAVATGIDDWINPNWFNGRPSIIAPAWGYTKPVDQMQKLDDWVEYNGPDMPTLSSRPHLNIKVLAGQTAAYHDRICSWCAFFQTEFTRTASHLAYTTCGVGQIPVPSQDGFMFYVAARLGLPITKVPMRHQGWKVCTAKALPDIAAAALQGTTP